jgi:putative endonuclease
MGKTPGMPIQKNLASGYVVYILRCADDTLYTGITTDVARRIRQHNGQLVGGAKYTRDRQPVQLVYSSLHETRAHALQCEYRIKQMSRLEKLKMINNAAQ